MTDWQTVTTGPRFQWRPVACADGSVIVACVTLSGTGRLTKRRWPRPGKRLN